MDTAQEHLIPHDTRTHPALRRQGKPAKSGSAKPATENSRHFVSIDRGLDTQIAEQVARFNSQVPSRYRTAQAIITDEIVRLGLEAFAAIPPKTIVDPLASVDPNYTAMADAS